MVVLPILAPIIMPILCEKVMRFALIKLTVKAVVAERLNDTSYKTIKNSLKVESTFSKKIFLNGLVKVLVKKKDSRYK